MKLVVVGTGYVGLISGLCFAEFGFDTKCVDKDKKRIAALKNGNCPFFEPGVKDLLIKHLKKTKLISFSNSIADSMKNADIIFITVGTPSRRISSQADLSSIWSVAKEISNNINSYCVIVTKSTVPVGTTNQIKKIISNKVKKTNFDVVSNPEFLREGSAIGDFMRPDRVVFGTESKKSERIMRKLYRPLYLNETPIISTDIQTAEVIKYASNSFLATKIAYINQVADFCEKVGANIQDVAKGMGIDKRIGLKFLHAGPGYGGSCFPKDVKAFAATAKKNNVNFSILEAVNSSNDKRPRKIVSKILKNTKLKKNSIITILGLSFKPNTDDIRESTSIKIANLLLKNKIKISCYDPIAMKNSKLYNKKFNYFNSVYEACNKADAIIIGTEWNEFRALNFKKIKKIVKKPIIFDLRNIYNLEELENLGFQYYGIGK